MAGKPKTSSYDPERAWAEIQNGERERKNPARWYDDVLYGIVAPLMLLAIPVCVIVFFVSMFS